MTTILSWDFVAALIVLGVIFALPALFNPHRGWVRYERAAGWLDYNPASVTDDDIIRGLRALADDDPPPEVTERILRRIREEAGDE